MRKIVLLLVLVMSTSVFSQKRAKTIVTIDGEKITVAEFKKMYEKNLGVIDDEEAKSISNNLNLYINYKLKVKEAYRIQLDTMASYKREIALYKDQLMAPYLQDTTYINSLVEDAY